jgi:hypothetical protein
MYGLSPQRCAFAGPLPPARAQTHALTPAATAPRPRIPPPSPSGTKWDAASWRCVAPPARAQCDPNVDVLLPPRRGGGASRSLNADAGAVRPATGAAPEPLLAADAAARAQDAVPRLRAAMLMGHVTQGGSGPRGSSQPRSAGPRPGESSLHKLAAEAAARAARDAALTRARGATWHGMRDGEESVGGSAAEDEFDVGEDTRAAALALAAAQEEEQGEVSGAAGREAIGGAAAAPRGAATPGGMELWLAAAQVGP